MRSGAAGLSAEKRARLVEFIGALPTAAATRLFAALESERQRERAGATSTLPTDLLLDSLRKQLKLRAAEFPSRPMTAERLFYTPFEDFFIGWRGGKKQRARIARASLRPIWLMLCDETGCASAIADLERALESGAADVSRERAALDAAAERTLTDIFERVEENRVFRAELAERLGGPAAMHDLAEIHMLLPLAGDLIALQYAFPRPLAALTEEDLYEMRRLYANAAEAAPDTAPYLFLALAARHATPWRALRVYYHFAGSRDGAMAQARRDAAIIVEALFDDLEEQVRELEREADANLDAETTSLKVARVAEIAEGIAEEAARARDNVVANRVEACRDVAGACLERFAEQSLAALRKAMPVRHAGPAGRILAIRPDYDHAPDAGALDSAREASAFLNQARAMSLRLGRRVSVDPIIDDALTETKRYLGDLVVEIRAAEGTDRIRARSFMDHALAFAAPLVRLDEVELFRERARAAALTA